MNIKPPEATIYCLYTEKEVCKCYEILIGITSLTDGIMNKLHFFLYTSLCSPNFSTVTLECLYNIIIKA